MLVELNEKEYRVLKRILSEAETDLIEIDWYKFANDIKKFTETHRVGFFINGTFDKASSMRLAKKNKKLYSFVKLDNISERVLISKEVFDYSGFKTLDDTEILFTDCINYNDLLNKVIKAIRTMLK